MSTSSSDLTIEPTLDSDPRGNLENWTAAVGDAARKYCAQHGPFGALHLACTDALWNALNPPQAGLNIPRPSYPKPVPLIGNEVSGIRLVHTTANQLFQDHADAEATLRLALLKSIGQTNRDAIRLPISGLHGLTTNDIIIRMIARHGQRTETDLAKFRSALDVTLTVIENFDEHTIEFVRQVENLSNSDPVSVYQAYLLYTKTLITPFPAFSSHITNYTTAYSDTINRSVTTQPLQKLICS
jgi:hypothetical protein